jgi:hypothetical protein
MRHSKASARRRLLRIAVPVATTIVLLATGLILAATATRPHNVVLRTYIEIYQQGKNGAWEKIDEVGPTSVNFSASLLELAMGRGVASDFVLETRSTKGRRYSARLTNPAALNHNPATGRAEVNLVFEVTYDGAKATVPALLTTESLGTPAGTRRGSRAKGILGGNPTTVTFVSANRFEPAGASVPLMLVCTEQYTLTPKGRG